ncbi:hypothetical protein pb186bvf_010581 [Paramecium bursaria]
MDADISSKIRHVIEVTLLPIIAQQQEKIEKLEKLVESLQARIELMETKSTKPQRAATATSFQPKMNSQTQKSTAALEQVKTSETSRTTLQNKPQTTKRDNDVKSPKQTQFDKVSASQVIKKLPEPKQLEKQSSAKLQETPKQPIQRSTSKCNYMKCNYLEYETQKKHDSPPKVTKINKEKAHSMILNHNPKQLELATQQDFKDLKAQLDSDIDLISPINSNTKQLNVNYSSTTKESFDMIEMNFVGDLLALKEIPDQVKQIVYIFMVIIGEKIQLSDNMYWAKASTFLKLNQKKFPQFLDQVKMRSYPETEIFAIKTFISQNPYVADPDKYDFDALSSALSYFVKDVYNSIK